MHLQARRSARLVARPILQPESSYHLKTMMQRYLRNRKKTAMMHLLEAIAELLPWENSKLMSVVQAKLTISNINQAVPYAAGSWCQGTIQSCQLEFWNLCQVETSQNFIVKRSNKMLIWLGSLSGSPLNLSEVKPTWLPLWNPYGAGPWMCRSYWEDTVGTWRCPVAVAVTWNDLATLWYFIRLNSAQIGQVDCFFCRGLHWSRFFGSAHLSAHSFSDMGHFHWESWGSAISSPYLGPSIPWCKLSVSTKDFHRCGFNRTMGPSTLRSAKSLRSVIPWRTNLWTWPLFVSTTTRNPTK